MWKFLSNIILKNRIVIIIMITALTVFMAQKGREAAIALTTLPQDNINRSRQRPLDNTTAACL